MPDEEKTTGAVTDAAKAIAAITENIPIYQDAVQPAAKEIGKSLGLVMRAVNTALLPVEGFIWGVDQIKDFVSEKVAKKLANVPPEDIQPPKAHVGVPAIDALRYTGSEPDLADLYANLLATAMDRKTALTAHPGFVDMIKNMSPDEARVMRFLATNTNYPLIDIHLVTLSNNSYTITHRRISLLGIDSKCQHPELTSSYIDNLERLGLVHCFESSHITNDAVYKRIEEFPQIKEILATLAKSPEQKAEPQKRRMEVTTLGIQFIKACVADKELQKR